jgi:polyribonucleotide nucleotidyltransferase
MVKKFHSKEFGYEVTVGKFAQQADGAIWLQKGGTVVLATVVAEPTSEFPGFLPLTVEYREQLSAAGKIPGGYYKREGKSTDKEILTSRLIDRAIRPLFPANFFDQIQILVTVYSVDKEHAPHTLALLASSLALSISKIPFLGPVGVAEVGRINGAWVVNPTYSQMQESDVKIVVAGTEDGINMVEGNANQISEQQLVDIFFMAHEKIKDQVAWQREMQTEVGKPKQEIGDIVDWKTWTDRAREYLTDEKVQTLFVANKIDRIKARDIVQTGFLQPYEADIEAGTINKKILEYIFDVELKAHITRLIFRSGKRIDGRVFDQVRSISTEVGLLPFTHGSSLFNRGMTQALATVTLGGGQDEQKVEDLMGDTLKKSFMLHYNFPPFSVGEIWPIRGPGRREVGHSYLAAAAIEQVLPSKEDFPYTIRIVVDILGSDGSTSMATACSATMALMYAGVPIRKMVSGIAMGLLAHDSAFQALSDISGIEDEFGLMDFKVAGTDQGITAIQMDIKYKGGLPRSVFDAALAQAKRGREYILHEMQKVMSAPNEKLSDLVPHIVSFKVAVDKIGAIIGTGGKTIREIIDKTGTSIDVEPDGLVKIYGHPGPKLDQAVKWVKVLSGQIEKGTVYTGKVRRIADFGIFVELVPGVDGLVHISMIPRHLQPKLASLFKIDDVVDVEVMDYDESTGRIRLKLLHKFDDKR